MNEDFIFLFFLQQIHDRLSLSFLFNFSISMANLESRNRFCRAIVKYVLLLLQQVVGTMHTLIILVPKPYISLSKYLYC